MSYRNVSFLVAAAFIMGCAEHDTGPKILAGDADVLLPVEMADPALTAAPDQASLPGLLYDKTPGTPAPAKTKATCVYTAATGRTVCTATFDGLTTTTSTALFDQAGKAQEKITATTASMNTQVTVTGTSRHPNDTTTINSKSDLTVTGLLTTLHTSNGTESSTQVRVLKDGKTGWQKAIETSTSKTTNVVIRGLASAPGTKTSTTSADPVKGSPAAEPAWPLSGSVVKTSTVTSTIVATGETHTHNITETITFNGTNLVPDIIVRDGVSQKCTQDLRTKKVVCQ